MLHCLTLLSHDSLYIIKEFFLSILIYCVNVLYFIFKENGPNIFATIIAYTGYLKYIIIDFIKRHFFFTYETPGSNLTRAVSAN